MISKIEEIEMAAHRAELSADLERLFTKYRAIFGWDIPEVDVAHSDRLILESLRSALDDIEQQAAVSRR